MAVPSAKLINKLVFCLQQYGLTVEPRRRRCHHSRMNPTDKSKNIAKIVTAFNSGDLVLGNTLFDEAGGDQFAFKNGFDALGEVLSAMPSEHWRDHEAALCGLVVYLCKFGQAARAHAHLTDPNLTFDKTVRFTIVELLVTIHLGDPIRADDIERWTFLERRLPISNPLIAGLYCNAMLVILVRVGRLKEARSFGVRAIAAFRAANHSHLEHFIHLHLADLSIVEGHLRQGRRHLISAKACLASSGETHGNEAQLSEIVDLLLDYETGEFSHIPARAGALRDSLVSGDSWAEIFNQLGRIAVLSIYFTAGRDAALQELAAFQVGYAQRHGRHSDVLALLEIEIDRLDHSLGGAVEGLAQLEMANLKGPIGSVLLAGIVEALELNEIAVTNVPGPMAALNATLRQAARKTGQPRRRLVQQAFFLAIRESHAAPFIENRDALSGIGDRLTASSFARGHAQLARMARKVMRLVEQSYWIPAPMKELGITHRQLRVMTALQSGATNKEIARLLGLSEATVKYHLANLFRITNTRKRGQLIEYAMKI